ncbi:MAG: hypothetical protein M3Y08_20600, partial [Fibrobacterota bacterium]|nr:hypothetical protein [Fibrobacterota bacterium]
VAGSIVGDPMKFATYTLTGIKANHTLAAKFTIKTFTVKVYGRDLCVRQIATCPRGEICGILLCFAGSGPDSSTFTANYGASYNISTDDSLGTRPFLNWNKDGDNIATTLGIATGPITSNVTYTAVYKSIIIRCCPGPCCVIGSGPIPIQPSITSPSMSIEPVQDPITPLLKN